MNLKSLIKKTIHYAAIGGIGFIINLAVFHISLAAGQTANLSNYLAIGISITANFGIAAKTRLFPPNAGARANFLKFAHWTGCSLSGIITNLLTFHLALNSLGASETNILATLIGMGTSFGVALVTRLFPVE